MLNYRVVSEETESNENLRISHKLYLLKNYSPTEFQKKLGDSYFAQVELVWDIADNIMYIDHLEHAAYEFRDLLNEHEKTYFHHFLVPYVLAFARYKKCGLIVIMDPDDIQTNLQNYLQKSSFQMGYSPASNFPVLVCAGTQNPAPISK